MLCPLHSLLFLPLSLERGLSRIKIYLRYHTRVHQNGQAETPLRQNAEASGLLPVEVEDPGTLRRWLGVEQEKERRSREERNSRDLWEAERQPGGIIHIGPSFWPFRVFVVDGHIYVYI